MDEEKLHTIASNHIQEELKNLSQISGEPVRQSQFLEETFEIDKKNGDQKSPKAKMVDIQKLSKEMKAK